MTVANKQFFKVCLLLDTNLEADSFRWFGRHTIMAVNIRLEWRHSLMVAPREEQWVGRNFTKTRRGSGPSVAARSTWIWKSPALLAHAEFLTASFFGAEGHCVLLHSRSTLGKDAEWVGSTW